MDNFTGELIPNLILDRESIDEFLLVIKATELPNPVKRLAFSAVKVTVEDINDNAPVMEAEKYDVMIPENLPNQSHVITVGAMDADIVS